MVDRLLSSLDLRRGVQEAPRIRVYNNEHALVRAGAEDALRWRADEHGQGLCCPTSVFPDRSWLVQPSGMTTGAT